MTEDEGSRTDHAAESIEHDPTSGASARPDRKPPRKRLGVDPDVKKMLTERVRAAKKKAKKAKGTKKKRSQGRPAVKGDGKPGRPPWEPTDEEKEQITAILGLGLSYEYAAVIVGVSEETLLTHRDKFTAWERIGKATSLSRVRQSCYDQAVGGSLGHIRFFEERVHGYIPNAKVQHTGDGGGPIKTERKVLLSDDDISARLRTLIDRIGSVTSHDDQEAEDHTADDAAFDRVGAESAVPAAESTGEPARTEAEIEAEAAARYAVLGQVADALEGSAFTLLANLNASITKP